MTGHYLNRRLLTEDFAGRAPARPCKVNWRSSWSPGTGPTPPGAGGLREAARSDAGTGDGRSRAPNGRRRRRRCGARGEGATDVEETPGGARQRRIVTRNMNPGSRKAERRCGGRDMVGGGAAMELHGDKLDLAMRRGRELRVGSE